MTHRLLQISGSLLLLGCAVFALLRLKSADDWSGTWILVVAAGVALTLLGTITKRASTHGKR